MLYGHCSALKLFSALADVLVWILHSRGVVSALHYLDDFLLLGPWLFTKLLFTQFLLQVRNWAFPAPEKLEGPTMVLTFLGIEIDMVANRLCLPQEKVHDIHVTTYLQMDAIRGKTGSYLIAEKKKSCYP